LRRRGRQAKARCRLLPLRRPPVLRPPTWLMGVAAGAGLWSESALDTRDERRLRLRSLGSAAVTVTASVG